MSKKYLALSLFGASLFASLCDSPKVQAGNGMSITNEQIRNTISQHKNELNECYQKYVARGFDAQGKMTLKWNIHPDGHASHVRAVQSIDVFLDRCISKKLRTWNFPKTGNDQIAEVKFPFVFKNKVKK